MSKQQIVPVEAKVFTKEHPVTKVDFYLCFFGSDGKPKRRAVVEARGVIGLNAVKYWKREGLLEQYEEGGVDWWELTPEGRNSLLTGLERHLQLHPEDRARLPGKSKPSARPRIRARKA